MKYLVALITLLVCETIYIVVAKAYGIGAPVSPRSSHKRFTPTGGGIIFPIAVLLFALFFRTQLSVSMLLMLSGMCILATISMIDDIKSLSPTIRLIVQLLVVGTLYYNWLTPNTLDIYVLILICGVGFINAFNFMDGINGIMSAYAIVTLAAIFGAFIVNGYSPECNYCQLIIYVAIAVLVFSLFNLRHNAVIFAGDVGSITLGFVIMYLMSMLIIENANATYLAFLLVYAVDSVLTILGRLFAGENIFLPHRRHLYQLLANQLRIPHFRIALTYAALQLVIDIVYFFIPQYLRWFYVIVITVVLVSSYFIIKGRIPQKQSNIKYC